MPRDRLASSVQEASVLRTGCKRPLNTMQASSGDDADTKDCRIPGRSRKAGVYRRHVALYDGHVVLYGRQVVLYDGQVPLRESREPTLSRHKRDYAPSAFTPSPHRQPAGTQQDGVKAEVSQPARAWFHTVSPEPVRFARAKPIYSTFGFTEICRS